MSFKNVFENFYKNNFGNVFLSPPVFHKFPVGLRFEIGNKNADNEQKYIENAKSRALSIFNELFGENEKLYLVVDSYEKYRDFYDEEPVDNVSIIKDLVSKIDNEYCYEKLVQKYDNDEGEYPYSRYVIETTVNFIDAEKLISKIVESELKNNSALANSLFFINKNSGILYFLYDDRGLDVVAKDEKNLKDIYIKFNDWVLDSDIQKTETI